MTSKPTLIVMARAPRLGQGKTRLARDVGRVEALRINRALHAATMRVALDPRWRTILCVTPDRDVNLVLPRVWPISPSCGAGGVRQVQGAGDLGARLARALAGHRHVAVVGTDCPAITRTHVAAAFRALRRKGFALGLADDGGFWVLAARDGKAAARAMSQVRWSSAHTSADVIAALGVGNVAVLATLRDIDTLTDWRAYRSARRPSSGA
jgi:glycosyltransferase A (GT-A) superfamily protein (DUF2064 family)